MRAILRVRKKRESREPGGIETQAADRPLAEASADDGEWFGRLIKLIPAESTALYAAGYEIARTQDILTWWAVVCLAVTIAVRAFGTYEPSKGVQWKSIGIATVSFGLWVHALGNHLPGLSEVPTGVASLAVFTWVTVTPLFYKGD